MLSFCSFELKDNTSAPIFFFFYWCSSALFKLEGFSHFGKKKKINKTKQKNPSIISTTSTSPWQGEKKAKTIQRAPTKFFFNHFFFPFNSLVVLDSLMYVYNGNSVKLLNISTPRVSPPLRKLLKKKRRIFCFVLFYFSSSSSHSNPFRELHNTRNG